MRHQLVASVFDGGMVSPTWNIEKEEPGCRA